MSPASRLRAVYQVCESLGVSEQHFFGPKRGG